MGYFSALHSSEIQRFLEFKASVVAIVFPESMRKSFTRRSDKVKDGEVGSNQEGIAKSRDSLDTNKGTPKKNEANLTPAIQMRLTNCEDESEFETLEPIVIALDSSGQELGNETLGES